MDQYQDFFNQYKQTSLWCLCSLGSYFYCKSVHNQLQNEKKEIKYQKEWTASKVIQKIKNMNSEIRHNCKNTDNINEIQFKGIVEGVVTNSSNTSIKSILALPNEYLIVENYQEPIYSGYQSNRKDNIVVRKHDQFELLDQLTQQKITVQYNNNCNLELANKTFEHQILFELDFLKSLYKYFTKILNILPIFMSRGVIIGIRDKEVGILIGDTVQIYADIIYNFEQKTLKIKDPWYIFKQKKQILNLIYKKISQYKVIQNISLIFFMTSLAYLINKTYQFYQQKDKKSYTIRLLSQQINLTL